MVKSVSSDLRKFSTPQITLSQAKYLVSYLGSHEVKSFIPPWFCSLQGRLESLGPGAITAAGRRRKALVGEKASMGKRE